MIPFISMQEQEEKQEMNLITERTLLHDASVCAPRARVYTCMLFCEDVP